MEQVVQVAWGATPTKSSAKPKKSKTEKTDTATEARTGYLPDQVLVSGHGDFFG